jgi:hypothetical protein
MITGKERTHVEDMEDVEGRNRKHGGFWRFMKLFKEGQRGGPQ